MKQCSIVVWGHRPVPMPRMTRGGKWRFKNHPVWAWRERLGWAAKSLGEDKWPLSCGVALSLEFHLGPKAGHPPDLDNLIKACKDALNGVVYKDDSQVREYFEPTRIVDVKKGEPEGLTLIVRWDD